MEKKDIGYLIKNISDRLKVMADADLKAYNLTLTQSRVMAFLEDHGGQTTQKEIQLFLRVSHPTVVGIVSRMEQNGHLVSWQDEQDRRNKIVSLTDRAAALGAVMKSGIADVEKTMLSSLSDEEVEQLRATLTTICENLEEKKKF